MASLITNYVCVSLTVMALLFFKYTFSDFIQANIFLNKYRKLEEPLTS
jgi:hypothetical protein